MQRRRPRQHIRRLESGRRIAVNKNVSRDLEGGSGSGPFRRGRRITHNSQLKDGMLVIMDSPRFKSTNVARVTHAQVRLGKTVKRDLSYFIFVNPLNPSEPRKYDDREFARWDYSFENEPTYKAER